MAVKHKSKTWIFSVTRNLSFWHQFASAKGYFLGMEKFGIKLRLPLTSAAVTFKGTETHVFFDQEELASFADEVTRYVSKRSNVLRLENRYRRLADGLLKATQKAKQNLTHKNFKEFIEHYTDYCAGLMVTLSLGRMVHSRLVERLEKLGVNDVDHVVSVITYPDESTPLMESHKGLLRIAMLHQKSKLPEKKIDAHLRKWLRMFQHIPVNFCEEPWDERDARKMLDGFFKEDNKKHASERDQNHKAKIKLKLKLLKDINDKEVESLSYAIAKGTILNEFRKNVFSKVSLEYRPIFKKLAEMGGSQEWRDCFYLTPEEMIALISGKKISIPTLKSGREVAGSIINEKAEVMIMHESLLQEFLADLLHSLRSDKRSYEGSKPSTITEVKGTVANRGKVVGTVKVVKSRKEFDKFKEGDILVTTMTSVDFVPIMGIAAAFVTNEGGITSHASIVSREMNKPCIIGTKIATEVFRDGDMVEVDAERGIVTKI